MERIDHMTSPPVVGRHYLVPMVHGTWCRVADDWPVIGPKHSDKDFFDFGADHYHIDGRFLTKRQRKLCSEDYWYSTLGASIQAQPLLQDISKPTLMKRQCWTTDIPYAHSHREPIQKLQAHYAGHKCISGKAGWICPHQKASLGSVSAIDGVITCPLHGLRIDASTGIAL